jgi:hypothetical protein
VLDDYGISGVVAIQNAINSIVANITGDYLGPWLNGAAVTGGAPHPLVGFSRGRFDALPCRLAGLRQRTSG